VIEVKYRLTLNTVSVEQIFAFLVSCESTFSTPQTLTSQTPQQTFALNAERRRSGRQHNKVVWSCTRDWINESL